MYAMDGNNSLKRIAKIGDRKAGDTRIFQDSNYYLPVDYVEKFAHKVKARKLLEEERKDVPQVAGLPNSSKDQEDMTQDDRVEAQGVDDGTTEGEGDPTDATTIDDAIRLCVRNWKSAKSEEMKRSWAIFDETGIFASACRHGFILWLIDMVRSGEL